MKPEAGVKSYITSSGELVSADDLRRAAGRAPFLRPDPNVAGYRGVDLAAAALDGDSEALDAFHAAVGLILPVREHAEGMPVRVVNRRLGRQPDAEQRVAIQARNQGGHDATLVDAADLVAWILSDAGRAALARRGVAVPAQASRDPVVDAAVAWATAERELAQAAAIARSAAEVAFSEMEGQVTGNRPDEWRSRVVRATCERAERREAAARRAEATAREALLAAARAAQAHR